MRRNPIISATIGTHVSIHAPWEGCDSCDFANCSCDFAFQFTHPGKGATKSTMNSSMSMNEFQFTHPGKGATPAFLYCTLLLQRFNSRTLGRVRPRAASRVGSYGLFQFTHPGKGATATSELQKLLNSVSIHAPWEGCDNGSPTRPATTAVSIHAPWEGCDRAGRRSCATARRFNSRTLGRVRP